MCVPKKIYLFLLVILAVIALSGCVLFQSEESDAPVQNQNTNADIGAGNTNTAPSDEVVTDEATVTSIDIAILESFPVQVRVGINGNLSDACTTIGDISTRREGSTFFVTVMTERPAEAFCAQVVQSFKESVSLDVLGLPAGTYTASVNGIASTFVLEVDNSPRQIDNDDEQTNDKDEDEPVSFSGTVLAGVRSPVIDFNKADYDKARESGKNIVLYFYANWCPTCKVEVPKFYDAFDQLNDDNLVAFQVSFNDNETDGDEKKLARDFGVPYQHTKIFLKNGENILQTFETWSTSRYLDEIKKNF